MRTLLAIPDPKPITWDIMRAIQSFGFVGARQDVHPDDHPLMTGMMWSYLSHPDFYPIFLLAGGTMTRSDGRPWEPAALLQHARDVCVKLRDLGFVGREVGIEISNEPDLAHKRWKKNPEELGKLYKECIGIVKSFSAFWHCLSPSISNLDENSLEYLDQMALPIGAEVAFHRYPAGRNFWSAQRGFRTRGDEVARLKQIANGAPLWNTEGGFANFSDGYTLTEEEQAERVGDEIRFWNDVGVESFCLYQLNDGFSNAGDSDEVKRLSSYGIRKTSGEWKRAAYTVREIGGALG